MKKLMIMVDLETLGLETTAAPIVQLGAAVVGYDNDYNYLANIKYKNPILADYDTIAWWMAQSEEARKSVFNAESVSFSNAYFNFVDWVVSLKKKFSVEAEDTYIIAHGFDLRILAYAVEIINRKLPFPYKNHLDLRSYQMQAALSGLDLPDIPEVLPRHNALSDAKWQARWFYQYLKAFDIDILLNED